MIVSLLIFGVTYFLIALTRVPRTVAALLGATAMVFSGALSSEDALSSIDLNVILLLAGMMVVAEILAKTGFFQWSAIYSARLVRGNGFGILVLLCGITAVASAFLDNVTSVVMLVPVTLSVCRTLGLNPVPFFLGEVFASNIGGAATLIGDPPNIIIGSAADIDFLAFVVNLTPVVIVCLALLLGLLYLWFRTDVTVEASRREAILQQNPNDAIEDWGSLIKSLVVVTLIIVGFLVHGILDIEPSLVALAGAAVLLLVTRTEPAEALREVQWSTFFSFVGLFMVVGGLVENGVLETFQVWLVDVSGGNSTVLTIAMLWFSGIISSLVDNIPYTATMTPVVLDIAAQGKGDEISPLWWALSLGANLGGNLTIVGASANVLVTDMARAAGYPISFSQFLKYGFGISALTMAAAMGYIWLRFLP